MAMVLNPEQEARIHRVVESGVYASPEAALEAALASLTHASEDETDFPEGKLNLVDLFTTSPFRDIDIEFVRDKSPLRDIDW